MSSIRKGTALSVVTLVFAILSAVTLCLAALYTLAINAADIAVGHFSGANVLNFDSGMLSVLSFVMTLLTPTILIIAMLSAAIKLISDRNGDALFFSFGLLTSMVFLPFLSIVLMIVLKFVLGFDIMSNEYALLPDMIQSSGNTVGLLVGLMVAPMFVVMAKKLANFRCIAMGVICLICGLGSVAEILFTVIGVLPNLSVIFDTIALTEGTELLFYVWQNLASPVLGCGSLMLVTLASFLAVFATLSSD